jgi:hypothetical protein
LTSGGQTLVPPLRGVLVRAPDPADLAKWREFGWLAEPGPRDRLRKDRVEIRVGRNMQLAVIVRISPRLADSIATRATG